MFCFVEVAFELALESAGRMRAAIVQSVGTLMCDLHREARLRIV